MISRYARPEMTQIWSQASKYRIWFEGYATAQLHLFAIGPCQQKAQTGLPAVFNTGHLACSLQYLHWQCDGCGECLGV